MCWIIGNVTHPSEPRFLTLDLQNCVNKCKKTSRMQASVVVQSVKSGHYCSGLRVGLGSDTVHGIGAGNAEACGLLTLADPRCDGTGFFDSAGTQCKCPKSGSCLTSPGVHSAWTIYRAQAIGVCVTVGQYRFGYLLSSLESTIELRTPTQLVTLIP